MNLPPHKLAILHKILDDLKTVEHLKAIVLGGSYAAGTATEASDLDIGLYYHPHSPFDIETIRNIAKKHSIDGNPTVTGFYEWGRWVNGGAWIDTAAGQVDFLYKNIDQVSDIISKAHNGEWENDFEQQPPYGFSSIIFLAETEICIPLYDPEKIIERLKSQVVTYPPKLKAAVIQQSLWGAEFTIWQAGNFAVKQDMYAVMGCLTRAVKNIVTALFAMNELYPLGDKRAIGILDGSSVRPVDFQNRIERLLSTNAAGLPTNVELLTSLWHETVSLTDGLYRPVYNLA